MARLLLIVKILPTGIEVDLDGIAESIKVSLKDGIEMVHNDVKDFDFQT